MTICVCATSHDVRIVCPQLHAMRDMCNFVVACAQRFIFIVFCSCTYQLNMLHCTIFVVFGEETQRTISNDRGRHTPYCLVFGSRQRQLTFLRKGYRAHSASYRTNTVVIFGR
jgi:hypothetical protein